jgi:hypothetical protein
MIKTRNDGRAEEKISPNGLAAVAQKTVTNLLGNNATAVSLLHSYKKQRDLHQSALVANKLLCVSKWCLQPSPEDRPRAL